MSDEQGDMFEGPRKDIQWTNDSAWMKHALGLAEKYLPHGEVMGHDMQGLPGIGKPRSPHSWGALTSRLKKRKVIFETGRTGVSRHAANNNHKYDIYWRPGFPNPSQFGDEEHNPFRKP